MSLSARRAWIEMGYTPPTTATKYVALRKESVDRNKDSADTIKQYAASLSARRAWIEIPISLHKASYRMSLSARRAWIEMTPRRRNTSLA